MGKGIFFILFAGVLMFSSCSGPFNKNTGINATYNDGIKTKEEIKANLPNEKAVDAKNGSINKDIEKKEIDKNAILTKSSTITAYYQDDEHLLIPVTRKIVKQDGIAKSAILSLIYNSLNSEEIGLYGVQPVIPAETKLLGINIKDRTAVIDFNEKLLEYKDFESERNIISSIVYTLTEFLTIDGVRIRINGREGKRLKWGTEISGILKRDNTLINSGKVNLNRGMAKLDIFYTKSIKNKSICVLPISKEFKGVNDDVLPEKIVEYLLDNNSNKTVFSEIPPDTKLLSSKINGGTLVLDFNSKFREYGGTTREEGIINQLLNSMKQLKKIKRVKILVEGKDGNLPEGTDISKEFEFPKEINSLIVQ